MASHPCAVRRAQLITFLGTEVALDALKGQRTPADLGLVSEETIRSGVSTCTATANAPAAEPLAFPWRCSFGHATLNGDTEGRGRTPAGFGLSGQCVTFARKRSNSSFMRRPPSEKC